MRISVVFGQAAAAAGLLLVSSFYGCSTAILQPRPVPAGGNPPWSGSAILMNYDLRSGDGSQVDADCTLVFSMEKPGGASQNVSVTLPEGTDRILVDAEPARYHWKSLSCSHFNRWMLDALSDDAFSVSPGRIAFVGRVLFRFPPSGQDVLSAGIGGQDSATRSLAIDAATFPPSWQAALGNPYTRKPITMAMLAPKGIYRMQLHFSQKLPHGAKAVSTGSLKSSLDKCDQDEQKRFPYRIGSLDETVEYRGGKLQALKKSGENSFSEEFLSCIDGSLRAFAPPSSVQLKVRVLL